MTNKTAMIIGAGCAGAGCLGVLVVLAVAGFLVYASDPPTRNTTASTGTEVVMNGRALRPSEVADLRATYGVEPVPGDYWYDPVSGLFGVRGQPAGGFMYPGHAFGDVPRDASSGDSGVLLNGRELQVAESQVFAQLSGRMLPAGHYWMDATGNFGAGGNPYPLVNLYAAAQQHSYQGGGGYQGGHHGGSGGGDNFWSTRFSAGNSDQGGSRGYVSVPGVGPVGYGFD